MVASTDIKFYVHTNTNAPQLQNAFGCMIEVLDACLVNGFGHQSVATLTASGTTVTVTFGTAHNFMQYQVIKITGANQTEFNDEHRILTIPNANTITFELAAVPSVTTATGTIICSLPPLGWEKPFGDTGGKAAYRSSNLLLSSRPFLRVVDELDPAYTSTYAKYAKVGIVEDMTDIDTMLGVQAPYDNVNPDKNWVATGSGATVINGWAKWYYAVNGSLAYTISDSTAPSAGNRAWILVGHSDYFYILPVHGVGITYGFGAFKTLLNADNANSFLSATLNSSQANFGVHKGIYTGLASNNEYIILQRDYIQNASYKLAKNISLGVSSSVSTGSSNYIGAYSLTNVAPFAPVFIHETVLRGEVNGLYWLFQNKPYTHLQVIEKDNMLYIAINIAVGTAEGQIVLKIGDL